MKVSATKRCSQHHTVLADFVMAAQETLILSKVALAEAFTDQALSSLNEGFFYCCCCNPTVSGIISKKWRNTEEDYDTQFSFQIISAQNEIFENYGGVLFCGK